ncbi:MAG: putative selenium-dependent hydroxylase accessory protein YqeC [Proteobacteria bacterium]|nr:putative selenium-dependent hydroxylase accessory protein YqeC [Pseudomonadota bacterium]
MNIAEKALNLEPFTKLSEALALGAREHIALVGGGGKTALLFALARELHQAGKRVLTSTTTKVWHAEALKSPRVIFMKGNSAWKSHLRDTLDKEGHLFLADALLDSGKVRGIIPSLADELYEDASIDYMLLEADGSAGRPVKAPDSHEPVIPASVTRVVALMGLEALGRPMEPEIVFRQELVSKITGLKPGERLTVPALSSLFLAPEGLFKGTPEHAKRVVFLNKLDMITESRRAEELAYQILEDGRAIIEKVLIGSLREGRLFTGERR